MQQTPWTDEIKNHRITFDEVKWVFGLDRIDRESITRSGHQIPAAGYLDGLIAELTGIHTRFLTRAENAVDAGKRVKELIRKREGKKQDYEKEIRQIERDILDMKESAKKVKSKHGSDNPTYTGLYETVLDFERANLTTINERRAEKRSLEEEIAGHQRWVAEAEEIRRVSLLQAQQIKSVLNRLTVLKKALGWLS